MTVTPSLGLRIDVHVGDGDGRAALRADVRAGLTSQPKWLPPKWLYDTAGCALFDRITQVPEYYPTRCERSILARHTGAIARQSVADTVVELGSGNSDKTRLLLTSCPSPEPSGSKCASAPAGPRRSALPSWT